LSDRPAPTLAARLRQLTLVLGNRLETELLLAHVLGVERSWLYAHGEAPLTPAQQSALDELATRRLDGEPMAYLLGFREFYGREFRVTPAVLIPRPETELLVDAGLEILGSDDTSVLDVGTGSGCIALTLAAERPDWQVTAVDLSSAALAVCRDNAARLNLARVELLHGDLLKPVQGRRFDAILSNPPYVAAGDSHLDQGDLRFEPDMALSADDEGLSVIRRLVQQAPRHLHAGGCLLIEHGYDQAAQVRALLDQQGFIGIESRCDLAGIERITLGRLAHPRG